MESYIIHTKTLNYFVAFSAKKIVYFGTQLRSNDQTISIMDEFEFPKLLNAAKTIANNVQQNVLDGRSFQATKTAEWIETICQTTLQQLKENVSPNFKYVVSALIVQKLGAGLHLETSAIWDTNTDGSITSKWENDTIICLTTIIGIAL